ncbi:MAG: thiol-disulfide isomerase/thioredoxin [Gammaproteobacteria bacterium]
MAEMPTLRALVQRMQDKPFTMIGVNAYDSDIDFRAGVEEYGATWPTIFQGGSTPVGDLYRASGYPTTYILDADGRIVGRNLKGEALAKRVEELVSALEASGK